MTVRTPGNELWNGESVDVIYKLFNDQIIGHTQIGSRESPFGKCYIAPIETKGDLTFDLIEISLSQAWACADNESSFAFMHIFHLSETTNTLAPPWMKVRVRNFGDTTDCIVRVAHKIPNRLRSELFEGLFHGLRRKMKEERSLASL